MECNIDEQTRLNVKYSTTAHTKHKTHNTKQWSTFYPSRLGLLLSRLLAARRSRCCVCLDLLRSCFWRSTVFTCTPVLLQAFGSSAYMKQSFVGYG